ncbi:Tim44/TimA family putative adaptor protein [Rhodospirillales bacterium]|nr:Tim44/TimA family putative adaptor protein [Rhodospirillales bacterium]
MMGEGFQFIDIVLFAMIAAFLILRLRSVLGRHRDSGRSEGLFGTERRPLSQEDEPTMVPEPEKADEVEEKLKNQPQPDPGSAAAAARLEEGFAEIVKASPDFGRAEFLEGVRAAFEIIIKAFAVGDREKLGSLLSEEVLGNFSEAIVSRENAKETLETTLVRIVDVALLETYMDGEVSHISVKIISEQVNVTHNAEGEVVDGNPDRISEITDIWTFARDTKARDPNWVLVATRGPD